MPTEPQSQPLVSIIVPVYNAADHIARCIESIRRQTYRNLEIILLNDGSKDVSYAVCQSYAGIDRRIVVIDKNNSGVSATRNLGMQEAHGKYFQFVDADDFIQPYATELLVQKAEASHADMVIAHYNRIEPPVSLPKTMRDTVVERVLDPILDPQHRVQTFGFLMEGPLNKDAFACGLMQEPASFYYGVMWNKLYRADIVREHPDVRCNEELDYSEDLYFNLSFIRYAQQFYALSTPIYNYVQNPDSEQVLLWCCGKLKQSRMILLPPRQSFLPRRILFCSISHTARTLQQKCPGRETFLVRGIMILIKNSGFLQHMLAFGKSHQLFKGFCAQVMLDLAGIVGSNNRVHTQCNKKAGQLFVAAINPGGNFQSRRLQGDIPSTIHRNITGLTQIFHCNAHARLGNAHLGSDVDGADFPVAFCQHQDLFQVILCGFIDFQRHCLLCGLAICHIAIKL